MSPLVLRVPGVLVQSPEEEKKIHLSIILKFQGRVRIICPLLGGKGGTRHSLFRWLLQPYLRLDARGRGGGGGGDESFTGRHQFLTNMGCSLSLAASALQKRRGKRDNDSSCIEASRRGHLEH